MLVIVKINSIKIIIQLLMKYLKHVQAVIIHAILASLVIHVPPAIAQILEKKVYLKMEIYNVIVSKDILIMVLRNLNVNIVIQVV